MSYDPGTRHPKKTKKVDEADRELSDFASKYCVASPSAFQGGEHQFEGQGSGQAKVWDTKELREINNPARGALANQNAKSWTPDELQNINKPAREAELSPEHMNFIVPKAAREAAATKGSGLKFDTGKEPMSLLSRRWLIGVTQVLGFGAKKYAAHNWRNGHERSRLISAAIRHILAYNEGEDVDPESGLNHLDHASCCLMFARETHETHPHLDDRWKGSKK